MSDFTRDPGRPELHDDDCPRGGPDPFGAPCTCPPIGCPCDCHGQTSGLHTDTADDCCALGVDPVGGW